MEPIVWNYDIPLLNNRFIWWDFLKAASIASVGLWVLVAGMGWLVEGEPMLLPVVVVPMSFTFLIVLLAFSSLLLGNYHGARFEVSSEGVAWQSGGRESKVNTVVTLVGALAGSATTTGAGLLAKSSEAGLIEWADVRHLKVHPGPRVISVKNSWRVVIRVYCPPELFDAVLARCQAEFAREQAASLPVETAQANPRSLASRLGWAVACLALTVGMFVWTWMEPQTETASRIAMLGGGLVALAAALEGPARRVLGIIGGLCVAGQAWALWVSALDPTTKANLDPSLGVFEIQTISATMDTSALVIAGACTLALVGIAAWRVFGRAR